MKTSTVSTIAALLILLVGYIIYLQNCKGVPPCPPAKTRFAVVDTQKIIQQYKDTSTPQVKKIYLPGDTIPGRTISIPGKPYPVFVPVEVVKELPQKVDTQSIIEDYYSKVIQQDSTIQKGLKVKTTDTVYKNRIIGRYWDIQLTREIPVYQQIRRQFYIGGEGYTSLFMNKGLPGELISAGKIGLGYINRRGEHLTIGLMRSGGRWHQGIGFYHTF